MITMIIMGDCKCNKCGYEWVPRKNPKEIKECPKCKSRDGRKNGNKKKI